ncbi:tetratricopeptide repeat protein [Candidatus Margulisiibacteriota bacterium]
MSENKIQEVSVSKIQISSWIMIILFWAVCIMAIWIFIQPFFAERHFRDGYNFSMAKRYNFAIEELELAIKHAPWETHYMVQLGKDYLNYAKSQTNPEMKIKYLTKVQNIFLKSIKYDPHNPWFKNRLANVYEEFAKLTTDKDKKAEYKKTSEQLIREAAKTDSQNPLFLLNLAYHLHRNNKMDEARDLYKKILTMDGRMLEARYNLAFIYRSENKLDKTLEQYLEIYKRNPRYNKIKMAIAGLYLQLKESEKAVPFLEEKIKEDNSNLEAMKNLAAIYIHLKKWQPAAQLYERLFTLYPAQRKDLHQFYIQALANSGNVNKARDSLAKYIINFPKDKSARSQKKRLDKIIKEHPDLIK